MIKQFYSLITELVNHEFDTKKLIIENKTDNELNAFAKNILLLASSQRHLAYLEVLKAIAVADPSLKKRSIDFDMLFNNEHALSSECINNITEYVEYLETKCKNKLNSN